MIKPRTMPGIMELLPLEQIAFQKMQAIIQTHFERGGFLPIETPAIERSEMLLTKTGGETERQVYFVQSTGSLKQGDTPELALRFDLTVPLARYVAEHEHQLNFPFRRYQMQRVYRGESAQRGRFREFYQYDIDVVGKDTLSIRHDAEIPVIIYQVFHALQIGNFTIHLNNRKLLHGVFNAAGITDANQQVLILREIDKLDKRSRADVKTTLCTAPIALTNELAEHLLTVLAHQVQGYAEIMQQLHIFLQSTEPQIQTGAQELLTVFELIQSFGVPEENCKLNLSIARGLDYYTGTIYETILDDYPQIGSICSGGRYDNLASNYTKSQLPGVGISIGATRLFYQLQEIGLIATTQSTTHAFVALLDESYISASIQLTTQLRAAGIATQLQLDPKKLAKQFQYADRNGIRFVLMLGDDEITRQTVSIKDMQTQTQVEIAQQDILEFLLSRIK